MENCCSRLMGHKQTRVYFLRVSYRVPQDTNIRVAADMENATHRKSRIISISLLSNEKTRKFGIELFLSHQNERIINEEKDITLANLLYYVYTIYMIF